MKVFVLISQYFDYDCQEKTLLAYHEDEEVANKALAELHNNQKIVVEAAKNLKKVPPQLKDESDKDYKKRVSKEVKWNRSVKEARELKLSIPKTFVAHLDYSIETVERLQS